MAENRHSEGKLVVLEGATAASNIAANSMVGTLTAVNTIYSLSDETTGLSNTGRSLGMRFIGVLDDDVSAGQCPITVWTDGVFEFQIQSGITTAACIGKPAYAAISGGGLLVTTLGSQTGAIPIGTFVGVIAGTSGQFARVKIMPGAFRWGPHNTSTGTENSTSFLTV